MDGRKYARGALRCGAETARGRGPVKTGSVDVLSVDANISPEETVCTTTSLQLEMGLESAHRNQYLFLDGLKRLRGLERS